MKERGDQRPLLAITMGDAAGIGPEVTLKALGRKEMYDIARPVIIGDGASLKLTQKTLNLPIKLSEVACPEEASGVFGVADYIDLQLLSDGEWTLGQLSKRTGDASFQYVKTAIEYALAKRADAVVTAPINKEAIRLSGHPFPGHTEIFSHFCNTKDFAMVLAAGNLRVIHVTTHLSMRNACDAITKERVLTTIRLGAAATKQMGGNARVAVAGLNPHSSEHGLFGDEEQRAIIPAIEAAKAEGIDAEGPVPPDTVFVKAMAGQYGIVVAMYHDQGHIPIKLAGFRTDEKTGEFTAVGGINCTVGLPVIRTSVDHGTAFDRAGKGTANEQSMADAIEMAAKMAGERRHD